MFDLHLNITPESSSPKAAQGPVKPDTAVVYDTLIVGAGPAGLNAALYLRRKGRHVAVFGDRIGGQMQDTSVVENYIGTHQNSGYDLSHKFGNDVTAVGVPILEGELVRSWQKEGEHFALTMSNGQVFSGRTVLIATGSTPRKLGIPGEKEFVNLGVSYCAICDGPLYSSKRLVVAGGGNAAVEAAMDLSRIAESVTVVQRSTFRADHVLMDALAQLDNVSTLIQTDIRSIEGDCCVKEIVVFDKDAQEERRLEADAVFVEIGHNPNLGPFAGAVATNENGEIAVNEHNETSVPGIFAAGDVTSVPFKQIVIAAADGAKAALSINNILTTLEA